MSQQFDVFCIVKNEDKAKDFWHRVGAAFDNGKGTITVKLSSIPIGFENDGKLLLRVKEDRQQAFKPRVDYSKPSGQGGDDIPF